MRQLWNGMKTAAAIFGLLYLVALVGKEREGGRSYLSGEPRAGLEFGVETPGSGDLNIKPSD